MCKVCKASYWFSLLNAFVSLSIVASGPFFSAHILKSWYITCKHIICYLSNVILQLLMSLTSSIPPLLIYSSCLFSISASVKCRCLITNLQGSPIRTPFILAVVTRKSDLNRVAKRTNLRHENVLEIGEYYYLPGSSPHNSLRPWVVGFFLFFGLFDWEKLKAKLFPIWKLDPLSIWITDPILKQTMKKYKSLNSSRLLYIYIHGAYCW